MMKRYLFSNVVANLRSNGGDVETFTRLIRTPDAPHNEPGSERSMYNDAVVRVELLIPFTYAGEELCVVSQGVYCAEETWTCFTDLHRRAKIEMALDEATECAIERAKDEIGKLLIEVRSTTSKRKINRKTRAVIKLLYNRNIASKLAKGEASS